MKGSYKPPTIFDEADTRRKLQEEGHPQAYNMTYHEVRKLQAAVIDQGEILNPVYCIKAGDSFLFSIKNPKFYPVYMRQSVMNTNLEFDFGAFLNLAVEMKRKASDGDLTESLFSFTFTEGGTYVFHDVTSTQKLMVVTVKKLGEECSDPDKYVQTVSGDTLSAVGVQQSKNIIVRPNLGLYAALILILAVSIVLSMMIVQYCMRKGWDLREMETRSYKDLNLPKDFNHRKEDMFETDNVFHNHKSDLLDSAEDDLDNINLNLQLELVDSAVTYFETYDKKKMKHKKVKSKRKSRIGNLISEMYEECQGIEEDARGMGMLWRDLDGLDDEDFEDDKMRLRIE